MSKPEVIRNETVVVDTQHNKGTTLGELALATVGCDL
jgi:hypothetical protein